MADRGRLFYASDGLLWEVDPTASISGEPAQADLQPVRMGEMAAEVLELDQQADDGTDRVFIRGSDGAIKAEVFFDGTNTVINPLTGSVDVQGALATEELDVTNETFVRATRGSDMSSTTSGTYINAYDGESKDVRGEFNSSAQFSPDETGEYEITVSVDMRGSTAAGNQLSARVQNITDTSTVQPEHRAQATGSVSVPTFTFDVNLDSAKTYELQVTNFDNSFVVKGAAGTVGVIKRSVVA